MIDALIGGFIGLIMGVIFEDPLKEGWRKLIKTIKRLFVKPKDIQDPFYFSLGNHVTSFIVCDGDGEMTYAPENIETRLNNTFLSLPDDLNSLKKQIEKIEETKKQNGESHSWNGPLFSLEKYSILRTNINEDMKVIFSFVPSDYYTFKALNTNLEQQLPSGSTIREAYLKNATAKQPVVALANGFGVAVVVVTADGQTILTRRSDDSGVRPGELDIGIVEAVHPSQDREPTGQGPDLFSTAVRGAKEELGLTVSKNDVKFLGFGVDEQYYQWNIIGLLQCKETTEEILEQRSRGISGKWELEQLVFVPFKIEPILKIIKEEKMWSTAKVALYWSLVFEYSKRMVDKQVNKMFL
jgi:hypothetical protein